MLTIYVRSQHSWVCIKNSSEGPKKGKVGRQNSIQSSECWLLARSHTHFSTANSDGRPQAVNSTSTLPPIPESPSPWQQPEKGPSNIFMAQNSPEAWGKLMLSFDFQVTDMQGSWVGGPRPLNQSTQRNIPRDQMRGA